MSRPCLATLVQADGRDAFDGFLGTRCFAEMLQHSVSHTHFAEIFYTLSRAKHDREVCTTRLPVTEVAAEACKRQTLRLEGVPGLS